MHIHYIRGLYIDTINNIQQLPYSRYSILTLSIIHTNTMYYNILDYNITVSILTINNKLCINWTEGGLSIQWESCGTITHVCSWCYFRSFIFRDFFSSAVCSITFHINFRKLVGIRSSCLQSQSRPRHTQKTQEISAAAFLYMFLFLFFCIWMRRSCDAAALERLPRQSIPGLSRRQWSALADANLS